MICIGSQSVRAPIPNHFWPRYNTYPERHNAREGRGHAAKEVEDGIALSNLI